MTDFLFANLARYTSLVLLALFLTSCGGKQSETSEAPKQANSSADTMKQKEPRAPESLSPNTAHIRGIVQSMDQKSSQSLTISFKIHKIVGYGPSTKPLTEGESLSLSTTKGFLEKQGLKPKRGDSLSLVVSQTMTMGDSRESTWRIVDFK